MTSTSGGTSGGHERHGQRSMSTDDRRNVAGSRTMRGLIAAHPIAAFALLAFTTGWPLLTLEVVTGYAWVLSVAASGRCSDPPSS